MWCEISVLARRAENAGDTVTTLWGAAKTLGKTKCGVWSKEDGKQGA